jgi:enoyl-[acyl-carrier-protein] reductase (NADH)
LYRDIPDSVAENPDFAANLQNPLPVPNGLIEPEDVSNMVCCLVSDEGRYVTGSTVMVDAGFTNR